MLNKLLTSMKVLPIMILLTQILSILAEDIPFQQKSSANQLGCQDWSEANIVLSHSRCVLNYKICQARQSQQQSKAIKFELISCLKRVCVNQNSESNFDQTSQICNQKDQQFSSDQDCFQKCCFQGKQDKVQNERDQIHDNLMFCINKNIDKNNYQTKKKIVIIVGLILAGLAILITVFLKWKEQVKCLFDKLGRILRRICCMFAKQKTDEIDKVRDNIDAADKQFNQEIQQRQYQPKNNSRQFSQNQQANNNPGSQKDQFQIQ